MGFPALFQGIVPTQRSNLCLLCLLLGRQGFFATTTIWEALFTTEPPSVIHAVLKNPMALNHLSSTLSRFSCVQLCAAPWTVARQAPLSVGFSRQEGWSGLPLPTLGDLTEPGIEPESAVYPAFAGVFFATRASGEGHGPEYLSDLSSRDLLIAVCQGRPRHGVRGKDEEVRVPFSWGCRGTEW